MIPEEAEPEDDEDEPEDGDPDELIELKGAAPKEWDELLKDVPTETLTGWVKQLDGEIVVLTMLRGYLEGRSGMGHGDQGHAKAVKECNRVRHLVRGALGYHQRFDIKF